MLRFIIDITEQFIMASLRLTLGAVLGVGKGVASPVLGLFDKNPDSHGTARLATAAEVRKAGLFNKEGLIVGRWWRRLLRDKSDSHMILFATTGAGKTSNNIVPNMLALDDCDIIAIDAKGRELQKITKRHRESLGDVYVLDPARPRESDHYNPLSYLRDSTNLELDAQAIAQACIPPSTNDREKHFLDAARALFNAANLMHWLSDKEDANLYAAAYKLRAETKEARKDFIKQLTNYKNASVRMAASAYDEVGPNEQGSFKSTLANAVGLWVMEGVKEIVQDARLGERDFNFDDLFSAKNPQTVYLTIDPHTRDVYGPWLRVVITAALSTVYRRGGLKRPLVILCDEADSMGYVPAIETALTAVRAFNVRMVMAFQSIDQVRKNYPKWKTVLQTSRIWQIFDLGPETETLEYFSRLFGQQTIKVKNGDYENEIGRALKDVSELRTRPDNKQLLLVRGMPLIECDKAYYKDLPELKGRWD